VLRPATVETAPISAKSASADFIFIGLDGIPEEKSTKVDFAEVAAL